MTVPSALTAPQLRFVWETVHDRYARQAADVPVHSITFTGLTRPQRDALAGLLGRSRLPGPTVTVRIDQLDRRLLDSDAAMTARQVAELLRGPIINRPAQRRAARQAREWMWDELEQAAGPRLAGWIHHLRVSGTGTRLAAAAGMATDQLVTEALAVAALLPADGIALPRLAERATG
ncbi:MAG TPA: TIGR02679 domain-containing protein, partial [Jiangellaceae bacterium]|nr:TIGR02679 domain-containing protein [Jiangellaceae bacterium]